MRKLLALVVDTIVVIEAVRVAQRRLRGRS